MESSKHKCSKHDKPCQVVCAIPQAIRVNPPVVPPAFPPIAFSRAAIDTGNNVLCTAGFQGVGFDGQLQPTIQGRIQKTYDDIFKVAAFYGATPLDALDFLVFINPDAPIAIQEFPTLTSFQRANAIRDIANAIQAPIYGNNAPARTLVGTNYPVLNSN